MKWIVSMLLGLGLIFAPLLSSSSGVSPGECMSEKQESLANEINSYRRNNGLGMVPVSFSLSLVAQWHVIDLFTTQPNVPAQCNLHSWSGNMPSLWTPVCYTDDHAFAPEMWKKPSQITDGAYMSPGFEIVYRSSAEVVPPIAVAFWGSNPSHKAIILERGEWAGQSFAAMGVGVYKNFAAVWFGKQADPQSFPATCP